ncbi:MAG: RNA-binding S4 domain-containing protein [Pedosphaera sp.]|nr:RNA-binding S4 domain-containing protein [Pedosphaera sp.]
MRLDKWLWCVRLYKTRSLATTAIRGGHVKLAGWAAKTAHEVKAGDVVVAVVGDLTRTVKVLNSPPSRVAAPLVSQYLEDLTPAVDEKRPTGAVWAGAGAGLRPKGKGRPTKRERRQIGEWME